MEDVNRIKLVLVEKKKTSKWLSEQMGVTPSTVSKWCTNSSQPDLNSLLKIADLLEVDLRELRNLFTNVIIFYHHSHPRRGTRLCGTKVRIIIPHPPAQSKPRFWDFEVLRVMAAGVWDMRLTTCDVRGRHHDFRLTHVVMSHVGRVSRTSSVVRPNQQSPHSRNGRGTRPIKEKADESNGTSELPLCCRSQRQRDRDRQDSR